MKKIKIGVIYKITYPNGKIYIGQDRTNDVNYFGSADSFTIAKDFSVSAREDFTVRKQILTTLHGCTIQELNNEERKHILLSESCNPSIGYNRTYAARRRCKTVWV